MTEEQLDLAYSLYDELWAEIHNLVNGRLKDQSEEVEELIRDKLNDEFRFWKGVE